MLLCCSVYCLHIGIETRLVKHIILDGRKLKPVQFGYKRALINMFEGGIVMSTQFDYAWKPTKWSVIKNEFPDSCVMCTDIIFDPKYPCCMLHATVTPIAVIPASALRPSMEEDIEKQCNVKCTPIFTTQRGRTVI